jgi:hypothetical protein
MTVTTDAEAKRSRPGPVHHEGQDCHRPASDHQLNVEASSNVLRTQTRCTVYGANGAKDPQLTAAGAVTWGLSSADRIFHAQTDRIRLVPPYRGAREKAFDAIE